MEGTLFVALRGFARHTVGLVFRPYETVRDIVDRGRVSELLYVATLAALYFAIASLVHVASFRPFLLTKAFIVLAAFSALTYVVTTFLLWGVGRLVGSKGKLLAFAVAWGYTLLPTTAWFFVTSLLYVVLPPPRTTSFAGIAFSILFLVFSVTLFFWKVTIGYLTLRFGLKFDLGKIITVAAVSLPALALYCYGLYRLGVFRVPFI